MKSECLGSGLWFCLTCVGLESSPSPSLLPYKGLFVGLQKVHIPLSQPRSLSRGEAEEMTLLFSFHLLLTLRLQQIL